MLFNSDTGYLSIEILLKLIGDTQDVDRLSRLISTEQDEGDEEQVSGNFDSL